jgi:hypothetical protein
LRFSVLVTKLSAKVDKIGQSQMDKGPAMMLALAQPTESLVNWPNGPKMRLIPLCSRRLGIGAGRSDLFRSLSLTTFAGDATPRFMPYAVIGQHGPCGFYFFMARHGDLPIDRRTIACFTAKSRYQVISKNRAPLADSRRPS